MANRVHVFSITTMRKTSLVIQCRSCRTMKAVLLFVALILISQHAQVLSEYDSSLENVDQQSLTSELVNLLNGTYFNLNENVCQLQRRVDAIERVADSDQQCECNETEINEFKKVVSDELHAFSKILSGFENQLRILQNEQAELRDLIGRGGSNRDASTSTTTTSPAPRVCDQGWISSPKKCYYVSTSYEKTEWRKAISECSDIGAKLVEIQTDGEASYLLSIMPSYVESSDFIYTGRELNDDGNWVFISNGKLVDTSVRTWARDEPDGGGQRCGCLKKSARFLMYDCLCRGYSLYYICEIER